MKKLSLSVLLCSITLSLAACGDNFLAANVSLGGSGSGTQKPVPGGNDNSSNTSTGDGDERYEYVARIPAETLSTCSGVERRMRFIDAESKQPLPVDTIRSISPLQIEIRNTTPNYIYEMTPLCRHIDFKIGTMDIEASQSFKCSRDQDSIQVLKPFETRTYEVDLKFAETQEPITVNYYAFYSAELPSTDTIWDKCDVAQATVLMHKRLIPKTEDDDTSIEFPTEAEPAQ